MSAQRKVRPAIYAQPGEAVRAERVSATWLQERPRTCLRCTRRFDSPHAGVRICAECRRLEDHRSR